MSQYWRFFLHENDWLFFHFSSNSKAEQWISNFNKHEIKTNKGFLLEIHYVPRKECMTEPSDRGLLCMYWTTSFAKLKWHLFRSQSRELAICQAVWQISWLIFVHLIWIALFICHVMTDKSLYIVIFLRGEVYLFYFVIKLIHV